ncbi:MAG: glycosyltransferase family 2 protein [bacterium]
MEIVKQGNENIINNKSGLVYIIILVFNGKKWLKNCINSVLATNYNNYRILIIDNASQDGSAEYVKQNYPQIELIQNSKNYGFAEGNNIGIRYTLRQGSDYVVLLNQDTKVDPDWIKNLVQIVEKDKTIGILGPIQYDYEGEDINNKFIDLLNTSKQFRENRNNKPLEELYEVDRVIGAAMLMTRNVLETVGFFDPLYFSYWEESDLCRRAVYHKFKIFVVTTSKIFHWDDRGHSIPEIKYIYIRNHFLYFLKDPNKIFIKNIYAYFKWGSKAIISSGPVKNWKYFLEILWIHIWILFHLPYIIFRQYKDRK